MEEIQKEASEPDETDETDIDPEEMNSMERLFSFGRKFLGFIVCGYVLYLLIAIYSEVYNYNYSISQGLTPNIYFQPIVIAFISLIMLVAAILLIKKYPIAIGALLCSIGIISTLLMFLYIPIKWEDNGVVSVVYCFPGYLLLFLFGIYILREQLQK